MHRVSLTFAAAWLIASGWTDSALAQSADPRLKEVWYDPQAVVTVPVKRGVVTHLVLDAGESITTVGSGLGAECSKADASWCIAAQPGDRNIFVKPKIAANAPNNLAVVTDKRAYAFRFVVLADNDAQQPVYRLVVKVPATRVVRPAQLALPDQAAAAAIAPALPDAPLQPPSESIAERLGAAPQLLNANYTLAEGTASSDIVPTLVFDDGRFTYLRFPNNREVPAAFQVLADGTETVVNARMEDDLLVIDRVCRRLVLRAGSAVVGLWNESFDLDGLPPNDGTTVSGVRRALRSAAASAAEVGSKP